MSDPVKFLAAMTEEERKLLLAELQKTETGFPLGNVVQPQVVAPPTDGIKIDIGCGKSKREGFIGVDRISFPGVDVILDAGKHTWPWANESVVEVHCSHMIEHLEWPERVHFFNELYRVLKPKGTAQIILPHWCSNRYYGDPTHKSPFSEMAWYYLKKSWREVNAPHCDSVLAPGPMAYSCDFDATWSYSMAPWMVGRAPEFINQALQWYKEAAQDMIGTLTKLE